MSCLTKARRSSILHSQGLNCTLIELIKSVTFRGSVAHLQDLLDELGGFIVAVHERPLVGVDLQIHDGAAEVILKTGQHVVLADCARRSRHWYIVVGATCSCITHHPPCLDCMLAYTDSPWHQTHSGSVSDHWTVAIRSSWFQWSSSDWEHTIAPPSSGVATPDDECQPGQIMPRWDVNLDALQLHCVAAHLHKLQQVMSMGPHSKLPAQG